MRIFDLTKNGSPRFLSALKAESKGNAMKLSAPGGWVSAKRPLPDLALLLDPDHMRRIAQQSSRVSRTVDFDRAKALAEAGEQLTTEELLRMAKPSSDGLDTLGVAFRVTSEYRKPEFLRTVSGVSPGMSVVAYCPSAIEQAARGLEKEIPWIPLGKRLSALQRFVIHHEFGHFFIDPGLEVDDWRFHDGFASFLAYGALADADSRDVAQAFSAVFQGPEYNYYTLLRNFDGTKELLPHLLKGDLSRTFEQFYKNIVEQPIAETRNRTLVVTGNIPLWPGFGARNAMICCGGEIVGIANLKSGKVIARTIKIVDGFFSNDVAVFANDVGFTSRLAARAGIVRIIPRSNIELDRLVASGLPVDEMFAVCEGRRPWPGTESRGPDYLYNACIPCSCGVFIITEEVTHQPQSTDIGMERRATCDRCGTHVKYKGNLTAFFGLDQNRHPNWRTFGGSAELEKLIKSTERWLKVNSPPAVIARLRRSRGES